MAKFKPYKLLESQLDSLPIQEGQFILTTDTNKLYSDTAANTRILISPDAITDLSVNGTTITYTRLDGTTGTITTKDTTYSVASVIKNGLMSASDKEKLDTIEKGAQANTITGVKGDSESLYRTGNVNITKTNIGLNNVENKSSATIRGELTNSNVTTALGYTPLNSSLKGANNGLAELDASGKVPASQLPSYVDDVLEYGAKANFPTTGETGKIYVDTSTNKTYRWGGSAYTEISPSIALGTTSSTAFRGDYGQVAYTHAVTNKGSEFNSGLYKIATNAEGHVTDATEVAKSDITALGIPAQDTTYNVATTSAAGLMSTADKTKLDGIAAGAQKNTITGIKGSAETSYRTGNVNITAANIGLGNVENKSSETIRGELTKANVTTALGYTPPTEDTNTTYILTQDVNDGHKITLTPSSGNATTITIPDNNTTYTFATGDANGQIKVTPSGGSAQNVSVKGLGSLAYKSSLTTSEVGAIASSLKGAANGIAELDSNGKVPAAQLPSYVDDVVEYAAKANFPATGETGKIYVDTSTNKTYRWSGSAYVEISPSLALGTTSSTAYRGDYGNTAYTHATDSNRLTTATSSGLYKVASTAQGHIASLTAVTKADITGLGIPGSDTNTTYTFASGDSNGQIKVTPSGGTATNISVKGLAAGAYKGVDTSIAAASTSTNLPTSNAVAAFVEGKGYKTTDNNTTYTLTQDSSNGHIITLIPSSGNAMSVTIPDNNTTYAAGTGISLSGTTFSNAGVRSIATGSSNGTISVNTNGTTANVAVKGLGSLAYKSSLSASDVSAIPVSAKGVANGVATLNENGLIPSAQLPSYVDDVIEGYYYNSKFYKESGHTTAITGESGKIYVDLSTNKTYRWSGSAYAVISDTLALGTTSSTAYRGDYGKTAYDHSQTTGNPHNTTKADIGLGNVDNTADADKTVKEAGKVSHFIKIQINGSLLGQFNGSSEIITNIKVPTKTSELINDSDFVGSTGTINVAKKVGTTTVGGSTTPVYINEGTPTPIGYSISKSVPADAVFTDTTYSNATQSEAGLMNALDKTKLDGITEGADSVEWKQNVNTGVNIADVTINGVKTKIYAPVSSQPNMPIGSGCDYYGQVAPEGFLFADGSAISRTEYSELFEVIGTLYGVGDGATTFNLPDKRERVSVMMKEGSTNGTDSATLDTLGAKGGEFKHKQTIGELATHNHTQVAHNHGVSIVSASNVWGPNYSNGISHKEQTVNATPKINNTGGGQAMNIMQPYIVCNYIIKVK